MYKENGIPKLLICWGSVSVHCNHWPHSLTWPSKPLEATEMTIVWIGFNNLSLGLSLPPLTQGLSALTWKLSILGPGCWGVLSPAPLLLQRTRESFWMGNVLLDLCLRISSIFLGTLPLRTPRFPHKTEGYESRDSGALELPSLGRPGGKIRPAHP